MAVLSFASLIDSASDADLLRSAVTRVLHGDIHPAHAAYLSYTVALLDGDNEGAADAAARWFKEDPENSGAGAAAVVAVGIGAERWNEAGIIAKDALERFPNERVLLNNAAYVLAMGGRASEAIERLESVDGPEFFIRATLGLAHLADGNIDIGMRLYREAAAEAETKGPNCTRIDDLVPSTRTASWVLMTKRISKLWPSSLFRFLQIGPVGQTFATAGGLQTTWLRVAANSLTGRGPNT